MAFLEDDDAIRAFEAALSFVEQYSIDTSMFTAFPSATGASSGTFLSSLASASVDDIELLSPSITPLALTLEDTNLSPETESDTTMESSSLPVFQLSNELPTRLRHGISIPGQKRTPVTRGRKKTTGLKMPVTRGDPNRARNERKIELAYLREKVKQMELELRALKLHPRAQTRAIRDNSEKKERATTKQIGSAVSLYESVQIPTVWKEVACRQRRRREKAERENVRLKLILENQIRMAKGLESLLQKRAKQQVIECSSLSQTKTSKYSQGRTLDFRADVNDFKDLLTHLDRAYREVDTVFAANGLATMETTHRDARMREGADYMYLDIYANKVMPFGMRATAQAVWDHFKGAEKHRGNMYEGKVARHLDTPDTIIEDFAKEFFADSARADFHAKQVLRRYVEEDREIVIWVSSVVPLEFDDQRVKGLGFRHQGYALTKRAKEDHTVYDPAAVRALTDFMLGTVAGNITASQELIENVLMDQDAANLNVGWDPSPFPTTDNDGVNSFIERTKEVRVDVNDYSRFKDIGDDLDEEDEVAVTPTVDESKCRNCSKKDAKLKCSVCKKAVYCARKCQASDWQFHKRICKKPEALKKTEESRHPPVEQSASRSSASSASLMKKKTSTSSSNKVKKTSDSSVVVTDEPDLPEDMRGYKNGLPYFHRELSKEEQHLIGDIAPQKIEASPVVATSAQHDGSAWNTAGTFEERVVTKWAEEKWSEVFAGATYVENNMQATLKAPEKITGDASICVVRGKKRYLFDFNFNLPFEVSVSGGDSCNGLYEMNDISNDEDYEISWRLTKKLRSASDQSAVQAFVAKKNSGLQKELVRLIGVFANNFQQQ